MTKLIRLFALSLLISPTSMILKPNTIVTIPATTYLVGLSTADEKHLQDLSLAAFRAVDAKGWGRIDAMQDEAGNFWLLEINTVPGMTSHSLVPMAAKARGMDFDALCWHILSANL